MRKVEIGMLLIFGALFLLALLAYALDFPRTLNEYEREPEDTWLAIFWMVVLLTAIFAFVGAAAVRLSKVHSLIVPVAVCAGLLFPLGVSSFALLAYTASPDGYVDPVSRYIAYLLILAPLLPLYTALSVRRGRSKPGASNNTPEREKR